MRDEKFERELTKMSARRKNAMIRAVNAKKTLEESGAKNEVEERLFEIILQEAKELEEKYGKWPVFALEEIESDDPILDIYHD